MDTLTFDARDEELRQEKLIHWLAKPGPRVGDFIQRADGVLSRFTHIHGDSLQTMWHGGPGAFYFSGFYCSYSGGLDPSIPRAHIVDTGEVQDGLVWFFHHDQSGAHRGVTCSIPCRVYRQLTPTT